MSRRKMLITATVVLTVGFLASLIDNTTNYGLLAENLNTVSIILLGTSTSIGWSWLVNKWTTKN